jgi:hypothetical protein
MTPSVKTFFAIVRPLRRCPGNGGTRYNEDRKQTAALALAISCFGSNLPGGRVPGGKARDKHAEEKLRRKRAERRGLEMFA